MLSERLDEVPGAVRWASSYRVAREWYGGTATASRSLHRETSRLIGGGAVQPLADRVTTYQEDGFTVLKDVFDRRLMDRWIAEDRAALRGQPS